MLNDEDFRLILDRFDRSWAGYRKVRKGVMKRLVRHMRALDVTSVTDYLNMLERYPKEAAVCRECLCVTISRFFRDRNLWLYLENELLPQLAKSFPGGLRAWSAGCAGGEEVFSLAILWERLATEVRLEILATDRQPGNLERARVGVYQRSSLREVSEEIRQRCFIPSNSGRRFSIHPRFKQAVRWQCHDLFSPPPAGPPFHLILLRNSLLTYHQGQPMRDAFSRILDTLIPGGYLIVGSHEHPPETARPLIRAPKCPWVYCALA